MNKYEVRISGNQVPIQVTASKASIALARALNQLTDSNFLGSAITIRFRGRVPRMYHVKAIVSSNHTVREETFARNLPSKGAALAEADRIVRERPTLDSRVFITSTLGTIGGAQ